MLSKKLKTYFLYDLFHIDFKLIKIYIRFLRNKFLMLNEPNFPSEIFFWERWFLYKVKFKKTLIKRSELTKESILFAIKNLKKKFNRINCIDVGCGPISQFYTEFFMNKPEIKIISVDPLAEFYEKLHKKYNSDYDIKCIAGFGETLAKKFPNDYFHLVYSRNAIDHSQSPVQFINNMYQILKTDGYMVLYGFINEGSKQNWLGLHKWDISVKDGKLMLSDKKKTYDNYNLIKNLNLKLVFLEINDDESHTIIYQKIK